MAENAILYDASKCSACKGCQVQCKQWNMMPASLGKNDNVYTGSYQSMPDTTGDTLLLIKFSEKATASGVEWAFTRRACWHCTTPTCMEVCPVHAISKLEDGTVKLDPTKCVGCTYCTDACPFQVPKFRPNFGVSIKCTQCDDRTARGIKPACVQTCPAHALFYGPRTEMLAAGKARVAQLKEMGFSKAELYGETEMGGMHTLFVAKYGYEAHGLVRDPKRPAAVATFNALKPVAGIGLAAVLGGLGVSFVASMGYKREDSTADSTAAPEARKEEKP